MSLQSIFYTLGIAYIVISLGLLAALAAGVWMAKRRMSQWRRELRESLPAHILSRLGEPKVRKVLSWVSVVGMVWGFVQRVHKKDED